MLFHELYVPFIQVRFVLLSRDLFSSVYITLIANVYTKLHALPSSQLQPRILNLNQQTTSQRQCVDTSLYHGN